LTRRRDLTTPGLLGLPVAWLGVFFVAPIVIVALYSFNVYALFPGPHSFTLDAWRTVAHSGIYRHLFWKSIEMSLIVSIPLAAATARITIAVCRS
jgi:ABC-type spermidine/putrescine transport system permease subunit I